MKNKIVQSHEIVLYCTHLLYRYGLSLRLSKAHRVEAPAPPVVVPAVPGRVGCVTNSASRGVQNQIVASAGNLGRVGGKFGRVVENFGHVGGKFGRVGERFWTGRREVWTRGLDVLDASTVILVASAKELSPSRCNQ